ncbi:MAG: hypothetical protein ABSG49_06975 [Methanoregula sp.]|jgi:hypothetical protein|uniref:hypothetical protein n=1 Tax=Methanoregula sp. TaxID=2052170 RepID=UPI003C221660
MSRGKRPVVAIGEAKRSAVAAGFMLIELVTAAVLPFDFVVHRDGTSSVVRVRRLKQAGFRIENILRACAQELKELRESTLLDGLIRELWVRGPARAFHRYRVLPETVEEIGIPAQSPESLPDTVREIKSSRLMDDPIQRDSPSRVVEIPYVVGLPVSPEIPRDELVPESTEGTAGRDGSVNTE